MKIRSCAGCIALLGPSQCRENLEHECADGGGFEMWRPKTTFGTVEQAASYVDEIGYTGNFRVDKQEDGMFLLQLQEIRKGVSP